MPLAWARDRMSRVAHQRTNSTGIFSASRRSLSPGRVLRQGMVSSIRCSIADNSTRGGREKKSGATGKSSFPDSGASRSIGGSGLGTGAKGFSIELGIAVLEEQFLKGGGM